MGHSVKRTPTEPDFCYAKAVDRLRVVTLNIWNRLGPWDDRKHLIRQGMERWRPDLMGLQEVLRLRTGSGALDQASELAEGLSYEVAYAEGHEVGSGLSFGNALLSRYPILAQARHELPGAEATGHARSVLHAVVDAPCGKVHVFVTHLSYRLHEGSVRLEQARFIADLVRAEVPVRGGDYPPILMGDLNAEPDSDEIRYLTGLATVGGQSVYFADVWRYCGSDPGHTFDPRNAYAAEVHEPARRIDYILVRGPDMKRRGKPLEARVIYDEPEDGVWPSDHFGVMAELSVGSVSFAPAGTDPSGGTS